MKKNLQQYKAAPLIKKAGGTLVQQEQIKNDIVILPELESFIPALQPDEYAQLEANILKEGCREPLQVWHTTGESIGRDSTDSLYVLIDGHNRYGICQRNGIDFKISVREFADLSAVKDFMLDNQLGRRNLTPEQMSYLRGLKYLALKKKGGRTRQDDAQAAHGIADDRKEDASDYVRTMDVLAEQFQVSPRTIMTDASFAKGVEKLTPELKKEVLSRSVKVNKKDLVALGELKNTTQPIASPDALSEVLTGGGSPTAPKTSSSARKATSMKKEAPDFIPEKLSRITQQLSTLSYPSPDLAASCERLVAELTDILTALKAPSGK